VHQGAQAPFPFALTVQNIPGFGSAQLQLAIDPAGVAPEYVRRLRRTYESSRLVELAAIAVAGLGLYYGGGHEMRDVVLRGSGADYLVDESNDLLEVAGRSRRRDVEVAWQQRWQRLTDRMGSGFYVCVLSLKPRQVGSRFSTKLAHGRFVHRLHAVQLSVGRCRVLVCQSRVVSI
jgi:hypothetical protein